MTAPEMSKEERGRIAILMRGLKHICAGQQINIVLSALMNFDHWLIEEVACASKDKEKLAVAGKEHADNLRDLANRVEKMTAQ